MPDRSGINGGFINRHIRLQNFRKVYWIDLGAISDRRYDVETIIQANDAGDIPVDAYVSKNVARHDFRQTATLIEKDRIGQPGTMEANDFVSLPESPPLLLDGQLRQDKNLVAASGKTVGQDLFVLQFAMLGIGAADEQAAGRRSGTWKRVAQAREAFNRVCRKSGMSGAMFDGMLRHDCILEPDGQLMALDDLAGAEKRVGQCDCVLDELRSGIADRNGVSKLLHHEGRQQFGEPWKYRLYPTLAGNMTGFEQVGPPE